MYVTGYERKKGTLFDNITLGTCSYNVNIEYACRYIVRQPQGCIPFPAIPICIVYILASNSGACIFKN